MVLKRPGISLGSAQRGHLQVPAALVILVLWGGVHIQAQAPESKAAGWQTDASCWTDTIFLENCCSVPEVNGSERGCWDAHFTFARCCGGMEWKPQGYDAWLTSTPHRGDHAYCSELARRFDWMSDENSDKFRECLNNRLKLASSAYRPPILAGQHFPTLLSPGPHGLMFALPINDFVVSKAIKLYGTYDPEELRVYKQLIPEGGTYIDVGANVGAYAVPLAVHVGREGRVIAAEPFQSVFQLLTANSAINGLRNMRTRQVGLGAKAERIRARGPNLEEFSNAGMARVFRPQDDAHAETFHYIANKNAETIQVITLDQLVEEEELDSVSLLKVDVEGHLKAVLAGGQMTLRKMRPIVVAEHSDDDALQNLEAEHGYRCEEKLEEHALWVCMPQ